MKTRALEDMKGDAAPTVRRKKGGQRSLAGRQALGKKA